MGVVFNLISQAQYNDGITIAVDGKLIKDSFKLDEATVNGGSRSVIPLADLLDSYDENDKTVILVEKARELREDGRYGNRITTIGVFRTVRIAEQVTEVAPILKWDVHHTVVKSLVDWLENESTRCQKRSKTKRKVSTEEESSSKKAQKISPASKESILNTITLEDARMALEEMRSAEDKKQRTSVLCYSLDGVAGTLHVNPSSFVLVSELVANCGEELHYKIQIR